MKRILGIALAVLLVLVTVSAALAGSRPVITQDPVSATTNAKGSVSFSVKVNTNGSNCTYTWYFVNPATGEKTSGRNLTKLFKKIKVVGPNRTKITLNRVPEEMHGWSVYCHVNGNGYKLDSQMATLSIYGMEAPATPTPEPTPEPTAEPTQEPAQESEVTPKPEKKPEKENPTEKPAENAETATPEPTAEPTGEGDETYIAEDKQITVTASGAYLYPVDSLGNLTAEEATDTLTFVNSGSFAVRSAEPLKNWTVNGMRFEPAGELYGFNMLNITTDTVVNITTAAPKAAAADQVDPAHMCKVTCQGCRFTYIAGGLTSVTEGEVPAGARINIFADDASALNNGYSINGEAASHQNQSSFRLEITEDTTIVIK